MIKFSKIIFIGGNRYNEDGPFIGFAKQCRKLKIDIVLIVDKERIDYPTKTMGTFRESLERNNISYEVSTGITKKLIEKHLTENTIIFSVHCIWILKQDVIDLAAGKIFNYHNLSLPEQRGAAGHSWRLMQNNQKSTLNIHEIIIGVDKGRIIYQKNIKFPKSYTNLEQCYRYIDKHEQKLFSLFLKQQKSLKISQDERKSFYWPRLNTIKHGFIDWDWSAQDIKLFCSAFDKPFKGASTFLDGNRFFFMDAELTDSDTYFHPFQSGLVYRLDNDYIFIATIEGGIKVKLQCIEDSKGKLVKDIRVRLGDRFVTPIDILHSARMKG